MYRLLYSDTLSVLCPAPLQTYVVKLAKSSGVTGTDEGEKRLLLLESGVRFHTTKFSRDKSDTPSGFTLKLRKHIRTRRLEDVQQRGIDRVSGRPCVGGFSEWVTRYPALCWGIGRESSKHSVVGLTQ